MDFGLIAMWGVSGWCGTPYPRWWWGPPPHPDPEPWWRSRVIGVLLGIAGGFAFQRVFGPQPEPWTPAAVGASALAALVVSRFVGDLIGAATGAMKRG
jgi:hypothetical protein